MLVNIELIIASSLAAFMDLILLAFPKLGVLNTGKRNYSFEEGELFPKFADLCL
jgi:hypothetical protein